ncbi:MAG: hypothetical protein H6742_20565 [Alphaproteobacteria bacterium]|nr:hypothetical protein [Alphaproteobacteria bacterium]
MSRDATSDGLARLGLALMRELPDRVSLVGLQEPACILVIGWERAPVPWFAIGLARQRAALGSDAARLLSRGDLLAVGPTSLAGGGIGLALADAGALTQEVRAAVVADLVRRADAMDWDTVLPVADGFVVTVEGQDPSPRLGRRADSWRP